MKKVPRLPWSEERFHTPGTLLYICSFGSRMSDLFLRTDAGVSQGSETRDVFLMMALTLTVTLTVTLTLP